jgi:hypothetical protein
MSMKQTASSTRTTTKTKPKAAAAPAASKPSTPRAAASKPKPTPSPKPKAATPAAETASDATSASQLIDQQIRDVGGWRGETLARMRALILEADPDAIEELKWRGTPVWSHHGIICTGETYKQVVKLTFARGASVPDPQHLFNSSLDGNVRRAIDIREGEAVDTKAFKTLVKAAVAQNAAAKKR